MRENFRTKAIPFTLRWEAGFTVDSGGATYKGISEKQFPELRERIMAQTLTDDEVAQIYMTKYWIPAGCDRLPFPLDCIVFDCAVNLGLDDVEVMLPEAPKVGAHLIDLFAALGLTSESFWQAKPYLDAAIYTALRIEKHNIKTPKEYRRGTVNRCYDALRTFL